MNEFPDHFSEVAAEYREFRPTYPPALFEYLASLVKERTSAWDCATGNGQAAVELAKHFDHVIATDASAKQIAESIPDAKVQYRVASAEASGIAGNTGDLVCTAQAMHWLHLERFYAEVRRVAKAGGILAVIGYSHHRVSNAIDPIIDRFEFDFVAPYWPKERAILEAGYTTIPFPFRELRPPAFQLTADWTHAEHLGYLRTWSATKEFIKAKGFDPVDRFADEFAHAWGDGKRRVTWRLHLRVGVVD